MLLTTANTKHRLSSEELEAKPVVYHTVLASGLQKRQPLQSLLLVIALLLSNAC